MVKLIVGLGNPGERYLLSRHNIGFLILDALAQREEITIKQRNFDADFGTGVISKFSIVLAKPQAFMNLSGIPVGNLVRYFKVDMGNIVIVHDDLDLPFGTIRIKAGGGDGGHRGLKSLIEHLGYAEFVRVRFGIDKPVEKGMTERYVLEPFSQNEIEVLPDLVKKACDAVVETVTAGPQNAMAKFNRKIKSNIMNNS